MAHATQKNTLVAMLLLAAISLSACGTSPNSPMPTRTVRRSAPVAAAPQTVVAQGVPAPLPATGKVSLQLNAVDAPGVAGLLVELNGPGLAAPLGRKLSPGELKTSNTLVFDQMPVGQFQARVVAVDAQDKVVNEASGAVAVLANQEAKVALQLSAALPGSAQKALEFKFVSPEALERQGAPSKAAGATPNGSGPATTAPAGQAPGSSVRSAAPLSKALSLEITDKQVIRKMLLLKRLQVTVRVKNENPTETLRGEVKIEFRKLKGLLNKTNTVVETQTAPVEGLAPGKTLELSVMSTVSAEDAEATVHTVLASSSAKTRSTP
ncbi:MAG: hypothetical protein VKP62_05025 [Candidatus Sericytochromatia bacterium]|nr:hypothetical protein [Candidatus Sericytochromatia bacterium]